ncbi:conserved hypothetical protein [Ricinus communis]|uniref:HhH-GPD domain-containing protein n=1 Tax=Ricinus communis TaxID=3988 RepID=B9S065_RICCO|nr:conserved hypothetical protein [Ricinus communis]|eukprot:XP_002519384.1 uncharacterized protein LOC8262641 [Ricinus communis]
MWRREGVVEFEVAVGGEAADTFDLEKTVCSHGLFMLSPNHWDPLSRTFSRPLRLNDDTDNSLMVSISQHLSKSLLVRVYGNRSLSPKHQESLLVQIVRMLRLSDMDEFNAREFRKIVSAFEGEECPLIGDFGGRVLRSPTLFEDMVKCILLCNCQWSRTLSMADALCKFQIELHSQSPQQKHAFNHFIPNTPVKKEPKRKIRLSKVPTESMDLEAADTCLTTDDSQMKISNSLNCVDDGSFDNLKSCQGSNTFYSTGPYATSDIQSHLVTQHCAKKTTGNFPSPRELANLDERFLAKRCGLGYRAGRIIKLAQGIVEGRIPLREFEQVSNGGSLSTYSKLTDQLREIEGFGPFTRANVLMCMGFYHVIPTDSETVRHFKQVHAKNSTIKTVQSEAEEIYRKFAPFQFLVYWAELWHFYEQRFGKLSEMPCSNYKLITASNLRNKGHHKAKRAKISRAD